MGFQKGQNNLNWRGGKPHCKKCGKMIEYGKKKCQPCYLKLQTGKNNPNWKGGLTTENQKIRNSKEYALWRTAVFERDNYTCIWCNARNGNGKKVVLNADHIKPFSSFPELRFAIDNGRTLCISCHRKTYGKDIKKSYENKK